MGLMDSIKNFYVSLENGFYSLMDGLDKAGIPVYKIIDPLEGAGIPAFPVFTLLLALIVGGAWLFLAAPTGAPASIFAVDENNNPLAGVSVTLGFSGKTVNAVTASTGSVQTAESIPFGASVEVRASKEGYEASPQTFTFSKDSAQISLTLSSKKETQTKTISFVKAGTQEAVSGSISVRLSCAQAAFEQIFSTEEGQIEVEVPADCGGLTVEPVSSDVVLSNTFLAPDAFSLTVALEEKSVPGGRVNVSVTDRQMNSLEGIQVSLSDAGNPGTPLFTKVTLGTGSVEFADVPVGRYYVSTYDPLGKFAEFDGYGAGSIRDVLAQTTTSFTVALEEKIAGSIKLLIKEKEGNVPVEGAQVTLSQDNREINTEYSDARGFVEFKVGETNAYSVTVDKTGYLIGRQDKLFPSEGTTTILLEKESLENSQALVVSVVDERGTPLSGALVKLLLEDATPSGHEKTTGENGKIVFERLDQSIYYVVASVPGFGQSTPKRVDIVPRQENSTEVTVFIGSGKVELHVLTSQKQPVSGASVDVYDAFSGQKMDSLSGKLTDAKGLMELEARADKKLFLVVSEKTLSTFVSAPLAVQKDVTVRKTIELESVSNSLQMVLTRIRSGETEVSNALEPGQRYTAEFRLRLPRSSSAREAGFHIRTGSANAIEKDLIYITEVTSAAGQLRKGTSFNPPKGLSIDAQHYTSSEAKWANGIMENPVQGAVYEIQAEIVVRETASAGSLLELHYRGWTSSGGFTRDPADADLGTSENTSGKQALYAQARTRTILVGQSDYCLDEFCAQVSMEDQSTKIRTTVTEMGPVLMARVLEASEAQEGAITIAFKLADDWLNAGKK
ncbi:MAG: DUF853 family protein, partial [Candidatus Diapherotrites archaeon]|nr:DUF853 family protein [Candidatus Diapherotrites archaeon]